MSLIGPDNKESSYSSNYSEKNYSSANYRYQPNFIVLDNSALYSKTKFFGDILVSGKQTPLANTIVSSIDSLKNMTIYSNVFIICVLSYFSQIVNNVIYQSYLLTLSIYSNLFGVPAQFVKARDFIGQNIQAIFGANTRELWWLSVKIEISHKIDRILAMLQFFIRLLKKFYLSFVVFAVLGVINLAGLQSSFNAVPATDAIGSAVNVNSLPEISPVSVLNKALDNHTIQVQQNKFTQVDTSQIVALSMVKQEATKKDALLLEKIIQHKVKPNENLEVIAEMYGVKAETISFNNQISDPNKLPTELYIPWTDGYIYKAEAETKPEDLEDIYKIGKDLIISENAAILNAETKTFAANSYIFLPTTDFESIKQANIAEQTRKENLKKAEEEKQKRQTVTTAAVVEKATYRNQASTQVASAGFIWPTVGVISRCVQSGHVACDIANPSAPAIFAVQNATVSAVYRFTVYGYGLAVVLDHGNGIKTLYAHMSEIYVSPGQQVKQGESIGRMGETGLAFGIHVHFEVIVNGVKQNPAAYLP